MPRRNAQSAQTAQAVPAEAVPSKMDMLEAFTELVSERYGYFMARRLTQQDMAEKTKEETKAVREKAKQLSENIDTYIDTPSDDLKGTIKANQKDLTDLRKKAATARKPFQDKVKPLVQAQKYCDAVAIPDSLKELGHPVAPRFSLSEWMQKALEQSKQKKKL